MDVQTQGAEAANGAVAEQTKAPEPSPVSRLRALIEERFSDKKPEASAEPEAKPEGDAPKESAEAEAKPEDPKEPEKPADEKRVELALAKAQQELKKLTTDSVKLKAENKTLSTELTGLKKRFSDNPLRALEEVTGKSLKEIFEVARTGAYDERRQELPPDVQEKLSFVEQLQAREKERQEAEAKKAAEEARAAEFQQALPRIKSVIEADADRFPFLAAVEHGAEQALDEVYRRIDEGDAAPNLQDVLKELNDEARSRASFWVRQPGVLKLLTADEATRKVLTEALGLTKQESKGQESRPSDPGAPKPALHSVSTLSEMSSRQERTPSEADRTREIREEWNRIRSGR